MEQQQKFIQSIQFLGIVIAITVLFNTLLMNLAERDTELATLRVLGAPMSKLGKMMFWEHLGIGLIGGILGAIFAYFGTVLLIQSQVQWAFYFLLTEFVAQELVDFWDSSRTAHCNYRIYFVLFHIRLR